MRGITTTEIITVLAMSPMLNTSETTAKIICTAATEDCWWDKKATKTICSPLQMYWRDHHLSRSFYTASDRAGVGHVSLCVCVRLWVLYVCASRAEQKRITSLAGWVSPCRDFIWTWGLNGVKTMLTTHSFMRPHETACITLNNKQYNIWWKVDDN